MNLLDFVRASRNLSSPIASLDLEEFKGWVVFFALLEGDKLAALRSHNLQDIEELVKNKVMEYHFPSEGEGGLSKGLPVVETKYRAQASSSSPKFFLDKNAKQVVDSIKTVTADTPPTTGALKALASARLSWELENTASTARAGMKKFRDQSEPHRSPPTFPQVWLPAPMHLYEDLCKTYVHAIHQIDRVLTRIRASKPVNEETLISLATQYSADFHAALESAQQMLRERRGADASVAAVLRTIEKDALDAQIELNRKIKESHAKNNGLWSGYLLG